VFFALFLVTIPYGFEINHFEKRVCYNGMPCLTSFGFGSEPFSAVVRKNSSRSRRVQKMQGLPQDRSRFVKASFSISILLVAR
jgi:hypothetical protein